MHSRKKTNSSENLHIQANLRDLQIQNDRAKKNKQTIAMLEAKLLEEKHINQERQKELAQINKAIDKIKKRQTMMPLIEQLKEHFKQLREQFGNEQYPDDDVDVDEMTYEELLQLGEKIGKVSKGLSQDKINKLQRIQPQHSIQCSICQEELSTQKLAIKLQCQHYFDEECIREWLKRQKVCPLCKKQLI